MNADERRTARQSLRNFRRLLALEPGHVGHLEQLARLSLALDKPRDAARWLTDRAERLAADGHFAAAATDLHHALTLDPRLRAARKLRDRLAAAQASAPPHDAPASLSPVPTPAPDPFDEPTPAPSADDFDLEAVAERLRSRASVGNGSGPPRAEPTPAPELYDGPIVPASALLAVHDPDDLQATEVPDGGTWPPESEQVFDAMSLVAVSDADALDIELLSGPDDPNTAAPLDARATADRGPDEPRDLTTADIEWVEELGEDEGTTLPAGPLGPEPDDDDEPLPPLLTALPRRVAIGLLTSVTPTHHATGEVVVPAGSFFEGPRLVLRGRVRRERRTEGGREPLTACGPGDLVGIVELVRGGAWRESTRAMGPTETALLPVDELTRLRTRYPGFDRALRAAAENRLVAQLLATCPLFRTLPPTHRDRLAAASSPQQLAPGERFLEPGVAPDGLFLVADGQVEVWIDADRVGRLGPGEAVGVLSAMGAPAGRARAVAVTDAEVYFFDAEALEPALAFPAVRDAFVETARMRRRVLGA